MTSDPLTEGERWTLVELERLRAGGWHPRAWRDFVWAAQIRANVTRRQRPALARQEAAWISTGAAAWLAAGRLPAASSLARVRRRGLIWWAVTAVMLDWHLGMLETTEGRAVGLGAADALTLARAWLVPAVAQRADPILLLIGGLSDLADGRVARATRCTRFGREFDGVVDACFAAAALRGAARSVGVSPVAVRVERARSVVGAAYVSTAYLVAGRAPDPAVRCSGRAAAPVRLAGLVAAGAGRRALADRLLLAATAIAVTGLLRRPGAARTVVAAGAAR
ncbi:MAG TPA: CDP-alcohol phosphatidyltransferase family protein [Trebonia sp.]